MTMNINDAIANLTEYKAWVEELTLGHPDTSVPAYRRFLEDQNREVVLGEVHNAARELVDGIRAGTITPAAAIDGLDSIARQTAPRTEITT
jgi:hypothetical protein